MASFDLSNSKYISISDSYSLQVNLKPDEG
jgi:hypothetical protein